MPVAKSPGLAMLKMRALLHLFCVAFAAGPIGAEDGKNILSGVATRRNAMQLDVEGSSTAVELASVSPEVILQDVATTDSGNLAEMKVTGVRDDSNPNSVVDIFYGVPYGGSFCRGDLIFGVLNSNVSDHLTLTSERSVDRIPQWTN